MAETLIERIQKIERVPEYIDVDKDGEMRKAFEEYAANPVVRAVMDGRTTFSQEYQNAFGNYDSWSTFLPRFPPEGFEQNIADLEAAIGKPRVNFRWRSKLETPLGVAAVFGLIGAGVQAIKPMEKSTRREFTPYLISALSFGVLGTLVGGTIPYKKMLELEILEQNAKHLDEVHNNLYQSTTAQKEPLALDRRGFFNTLYQRT